VALGRLRSVEAESLLVEALADPHSDLAEHAADALLAIGTSGAMTHALGWVSGDHDGEARARVAARIEAPRSGDAAAFQTLLLSSLARLSPEDPAYDALLELRLHLAEAPRAERRSATSVEDAIVSVFPTFAELSRIRGFEPLGRSLKTAEALYSTTTGLADADHSPPIVLWTKTLEGYVHAWLGGRLQSLQRQPGVLFDRVDQVLSVAWPSYQRFVRERWQDDVQVGDARVEVPLRSLPNALREYQERRTKRLDSPISVTEWARLMVFLAVDHASGVKNLLQVKSTSADRTVRLCHRLHVLAAVRNVVTHRAAAGEQTVEAFRTLYYASFEELTKMV
jgi:hypothetical protein